MHLSAGNQTVQILHDISFEVSAKQVLAIVGPSGSGKSTLLGLLAGLDRPTHGSIHIHGTNITTLAESAMAHFRRQHIGYVFQAFHLIPTLTALENVALPLELQGIATGEERAKTLLQAVGLEQRFHHYPIQLSGGEQQRVGIARAVVHKPMLLLADEPTGNLDPVLSREIMQIFVDFNQVGVTVLVASHDLDLIDELDKPRITLNRGQLILNDLDDSGQEANSGWQ